MSIDEKAIELVLSSCGDGAKPIIERAIRNYEVAKISTQPDELAEVSLAISSGISLVACGWTMQSAVKTTLERLRPYLRSPERESGSGVDSLLSEINLVALRSQRECEGHTFSAFGTIIGLIEGFKARKSNHIEGGQS